MFALPDAIVPLVVGLGLIALLLAFAFEIRSPEVTAIGAVAILLALGIVSSDDLLDALGNPAPLSIAGMFIISASLVRTGLLEILAAKATERARQSPRSTVAILLVVVACMSAFTNNTPLVMMMIPVGLVLARQLGEPPSRILMPISFAAILGGTCTMIGTSTNLLVNGVATDAGLAPFGLFEIAPVGIIAAAAGLCYLVLARSRLPMRDGLVSAGVQTETRRYTASVVVNEQSPLIGKSARAVASFNRGDRRLIDILRDGISLGSDFDAVTLEAGDVAILRCSADEILTINEGSQLQLAGKSGEPGMLVEGTRSTTITEALILPDAQVVGHRINDLSLCERYGVMPLALHRRGSNVSGRFENELLEAGDMLLFEGERASLDRMAIGENLLDLAEPKARAFRVGKAPVALCVLLAIVVGASFDVLPLPALVTMGVAFVLASRCIEPDEAFSAVDWRIIALVVAMLAIGSALDRAGLVEMAVNAATPLLGGFAPWVALCAIYMLSLLLTELVTNNAVAIVVTPLAIKLAEALGSDPRPFVIAVMFAASASFLTPIGYQTNTLVYGAGGYRFGDYARFGFPLTVFVALATLIAIPLFWEL
ncbi:SLC13 family permease [Croceicoccus mobilis]|uniref:Sodium:sulfate symporter n=1 Tax=Croceicoccus mobilis TaxID=1703339 RepID=A0A916ZC70_9SPHN|nr:SLC13 family permease [Croceicoccus mobilis]GGD85111.1 sodium:sulfate symporter [Croceicoccus mobilis]